LITHKHADHCDVPSIKKVMAANHGIPIFSNEDVRDVLQEVDIDVTPTEDHVPFEIKNISVKPYHILHAEIYEGVFAVPQNTAFVIAEKLFVTGDAVSGIPDEKIDILALPVVAPWGKLSEYLDFARAVKPRVVIPIHDAIGQPGFFAKHPAQLLPQFGIDVVLLENGISTEL